MLAVPVPAMVVLAGCRGMQAAAAVIGEEWLYEFYDKAASNVKFTGIYPGSMLSDLARKSVPGGSRAAAAV